MENHSEKIQDYIEGLLEGEELVMFEAQLVVDKELRNMVALQKEVYDILNKRTPIQDNSVKLKMTLDEVNQRYRDSSNSSRGFIKRWLPIVAAACLLIVGSLFFFQRSDELYELPTMRSEIVRGKTENISYENAVQAFNNGKYEEAGEILSTLLDGAPEQIQYQYYLGLSYIGSKQWSKAIDLLVPIANGPSVFSTESNYYLALAYYEKGDTDSAKMCLNKIPAEGFTGEKADRLRKKMD
ncbi:tetratricopeptide repeat protein [Sphingobacterium faecale]|uniref:Tetratricopeptide repeat protein n=1 Tax=Sphingobacterium faecale TaxID=2803775 RepID=A0ABS1QZC0_9SPHI|nr:tetratricopeptide repeat protein [Sphingobacterium faecale]MBL1407781.1 tetratricopeptide repeat protein [Sphingobacterium faecale]